METEEERNGRANPQLSASLSGMSAAELVALQGADDASSESEQLASVPDGAAATMAMAAVSGPGSGSVRPRLLRVEEEGKIVVEMKDLYLAGHSLGKIADALNQRGVPSPGGKRWFINGVARVLFNPIHCGYVKRKEELYPGEHMGRAYYSVEVYEQLLERRAGRNATFKTNTANSCAKHLINGIAHCGHCEARLYISLGEKDKPALRCLNGKSMGRRTCPHMSVKLKAVQAAVISQIEELCLQSEMYEILEEAAQESLKDEDAKLAQRKEDIEYALRLNQTRTDRLFDNLTTGLISAEQFKPQNERLLTEKQASESELEKVLKQIENRRQRQKKADTVRDRILDFPQMWERRAPEEKQEILSLLIEHLYVYKNGRQASIRIKLYLLPERTFDIAYCHPPKLQPAQRTGVDALTPRHMAVVYHHLKGKTLPEIMEVMGIGEAACKDHMKEVRKRMDVDDFDEAAALARNHVMANLSRLPLGFGSDNRREEGELLTPAQKAVWELMRRGATNKQIAQQLQITESAAAGKRSKILQAFDAPDLFTAINNADRLGMNG